MKKLSFVFTIFLLIFLTACEMEVEDIKRTCTLQDIKVDASMAKLEYLKSQAFNSDGVKIYGYYSDNTIKEIDPRYVDFDGFPKTDDEKIIDVDIPITVLYEGFKDTYNIKFQDDCIVGIIVDIQKRNYLLHEAFNPDDIIVSAKYESGNFDVIDFPNYTISGFYTEMANITGKEVTITYKDLEPVKYDILVFPNTVSNLIIFSNPTKTIYTHNESLDLTGLVVEAKYGVSAYVEVKPEHYTYKIFSADDINFENSFRNPDIKELDPGDYKIVIYLDDVQTEPINIKILNAYQTGMCLDPDSTPKLIYYVNEPFDINQYVFRENLSDGSIGKVIDKESTGFYLEGGDPVLSEANKKVTIKARSSFFNYEKGEKDEAKCDFDIFVTDATISKLDATWEENPKDVRYFPLGTKPSDATYGTWTVYAVYSDGRRDKIPNEYCKFEFEDEKIRDGEYDDFYSKLAESEESVVKYWVKITFYRDKEKGEPHSGRFEVPVGKPKIINAEITQYPTTKYTVGQIFNPKGLTLKITTSVGTPEFYEYGEETKEFFTIPSNKFTEPEPTEVKILFKKDFYEYEISFWVNVDEKKPIALKIRPKDKITYLRKGDSYTYKQYLSLFYIYKVYDNGYDNELLTEAEYKNAIIYFEQTNIQYESEPIWYGSVYAIFNDGKNSILGKYECFEKTVDGVPNEPIILILPPLPQNITMVNTNALDSNEFAESLTSENTEYKIIYKDGSSYTIKGNEFQNRNVTYKRIVYELIKSFNYVRIKYQTDIRASCEDPKLTAEYVVADYNTVKNLNKIKSFRVEKKIDGNYIFRKSKIESDNDSYNLKNYFKAFITSYTGVEQEVTGNNLNFLRILQNDNKTGFKVIYEDGASKAEAEITDNITFLEPITINEEEFDNLLKRKELYTNVKFSFKDEKGNNQFNKKIKNSELSAGAHTDFTSEQIKVSLNKHEDQIYYLTIPGSIEDIDGTYGQYEIRLFNDYIIGLVCDSKDIQQKYIPTSSHNLTDTSLKGNLSSSGIRIQTFFSNIINIDKNTDGDFKIIYTDNQENISEGETENQINLIYSNNNEIMPFSKGPQNATLIWKCENNTEDFTLPLIVYPAVPNKGELEEHQFGENDKHKGIKFTYTCSYTFTWDNYSLPSVVNLETYERFYDLFLSDVELINVSNGEESTETI